MRQYAGLTLCYLESPMGELLGNFEAEKSAEEMQNLQYDIQDSKLCKAHFHAKK
jgi:hypothetical protein